MRVIAGKAKGHRLTAPRGLDVRPTADRAKEGIFNVLGDRVKEAVVLDLFAGAGSLGIEALSRGALTTIFVEHSTIAQRAILENLNKTRLIDQAQILKTDVSEALSRLAWQKKRFDLIFLDPPYKIDLINLKKVLNSIIEFNLLSQHALVIVEHSSRINLLVPAQLHLVSRHKYGDTAWSVLKLKDDTLEIK